MKAYIVWMNTEYGAPPYGVVPLFFYFERKHHESLYRLDEYGI